MPNWCENRVSFNGSEVDLKRLKSLMGTKEQVISFQKIKPMPEDLNIESSSARLGYEVIYGDINSVLKRPWIKEEGLKSREALIAYLEKHHPEYVELAHRYKANIDQHGHTDWYGWRIENWGTKWDVEANQIRVLIDEPGTLELAFDTAWSPPQGIHDALEAIIAEQDLDVHISWFYDEPGMQFAGYL